MNKLQNRGLSFILLIFALYFLNIKMGFARFIDDFENILSSEILVQGSPKMDEDIDMDFDDEEVEIKAEKKDELNSVKRKETTGRIEKAEDNDIELRPIVIKGSKLSDRGKKNIQEISRHTMTARDLKEVPASFGDSINALTSLPGIIRAGGAGIFGPLVIRGADLSANNYFIDDIPVHDPLHFGGLHSVINTNLMSEIDVYASSFSAEFGFATAAIINITTIDEVEKFGGYTDVSLLSTSALVQTPILKDTGGGFFLDSPSHENMNKNTENVGYVIASGRYGYLTLGIKTAEFISGDEVPISPEYWDYQFKSKYQFDNVCSLTLLCFGHKDFIRILIDDRLLGKGDDPLLMDTEMKSDTMSHNQGLYFDFRFSREFSNRLLFFSSLPETYFYFNFDSDGAASWSKDIHVKSRPRVFGLKDKSKKKWLEGHGEVRGSVEYTYYHFTAKGKTLIPIGIIDNSEFDVSNEDAFLSYYLDEEIENHVFGGYIENKFTIYGLTVIPGIRSDYFLRAKTATFDPRLMVSYKLLTATTLSAAGGKYSYFFQTNPIIFNQNPDVCSMGKEAKPEKARHIALGVKQEIIMYTLKVEGFNNYFYDKPMPYPHYRSDGTSVRGLSTGKAKAYGFEIMIKKDIKKNYDGLYGWLSYTYTRSTIKTGLPTESGYDGVPGNPVGDPFGDTWYTSNYEQRHSFKSVAGYAFGNHTISGRFQYYSSFPYTPFVGSDEDFDYAQNQPGEHRYKPISGERNSKYFPSFYSLDIRYTHKIKHSWGCVSWYIEGINVLLRKPISQHKWYWDRPYVKGSNPENVEEEGFAFLPNFGVEVKF